MNILGISCFYHDAAAALVVDGLLVAAASEERFSRIKHDAEAPVGAVRFCLDKAGLTIRDVDFLVFYDKPLQKFDRLVTGYMATPFRSFSAFRQAMPVWLGRKLWTDHVLHKELDFDGETLYVPHHLSHAAGAFFCSPFDEAAVLTIDGVGEWATASYGIGRGNQVELRAQMSYPHSVGLLYSAFTYYLGFQVNSAEYKVMGLAAFGQPRYADLIEERLVKIFDDGSICLNLDYFNFHHGLTMTNRKFDQLLGQPCRESGAPLEGFHQDIAASIQAVTEKIVLRMGRHVRSTTGLSKLCMSGGVALNCVANGRLLKESVFEDIYVQPAAGDAGGAVGAALYAHHTLPGATRRRQPFFGLGPSFTDREIRTFLDTHSIPFNAVDDNSRSAQVAEHLAEGKIVGFYQGSMEFGPRALGFRSILADPRDPDMKGRINRAVKYREPFRPFAPAVTWEKVSEWFECDRESPYMLFNFNVRPEKRSLIPAVTHVDNTARIQTVSAHDNPALHAVLVRFEQLTGVPIVLNTSFNLRGHPIVNTPQEAFATFCSGGIDILALGNHIVDKRILPSELVERFALAVGQD
jgi:carbamoyltransferase